MADARVFRGAVAPERLLIRVRNRENDPAQLDFTTVTAVEFEVLGGARWSGSIDAQTIFELSAAHVWVVGDIPEPALMRVLIHLTLSGGGKRRAGPFSLEVL